MNEPVKAHQHNIGKIGTALSILCSIHCIATPILALFIPALDLHGADWIELAMIAGIVLLGGSSLMHGYKSHHRNLKPGYIFSAGIIFFLLGYLFHDSDIQGLHKTLMICGSILCAGGQIYNLKLSHY